jgi:sec-independent protein translocase protein TatA
MTLTLTPLILGLGPQELIIILVIVLLLFGGSRLAGLGKSSGRALKEFKEETKGLREDKDAAQTPPPPAAPQAPQVTTGQVDPTGQNFQQPPAYQPPPAANQQPPAYQPPPVQPAPVVQPPNNLADPTAPEARRDV